MAALSSSLAMQIAVPAGGEKLALESLCEILKREHDALLARDAERIAGIAAEKQLLLDQLSIFVKARTSRVQPRTRAAIPVTVDPTLRTLWKKVDAMNRINSAVLTLHASVVARALGVLRQGVGSDGPYNARGKLAGHYLS